MAFCAWCGNHVQQISYAACPRCGNPTNGAPRGGGATNDNRKVGIVIAVVAGGLILLAVVGIVAAIAIPNLQTAQERSKQKRTMAELRTVAAALEAYAVDNNKYPDGTSVADLEPALTPTYIRQLPTVDGWGTPMKYERIAGEPEGYALASAGADKNFERDSLAEYTSGTATTQFDADLVYSNGRFVQYPEGVQTGGE